jgi:hypothetical protein
LKENGLVSESSTNSVLQSIHQNNFGKYENPAEENLKEFLDEFIRSTMSAKNENNCPDSNPSVTGSESGNSEITERKEREMLLSVREEKSNLENTLFSRTENSVGEIETDTPIFSPQNQVKGKIGTKANVFTYIPKTTRTTTSENQTVSQCSKSQSITTQSKHSCSKFKFCRQSKKWERA